MSKNRTYAIVAAIALAAVALFVWKCSGDKKSEPKDEKQVVDGTKPGKKSKRVKRKSRTASAPAGMPEVSEDDDPVGTLRLEGQVLDDAGQGVANATVAITSRPMKTTKTDTDGSFHFDKLVGRTYAVYARADDMVGGPVMHKLSESSDPVVVKVQRGATITVKVLGEREKPLSNAEVKIEAAKLETTTNAKGIAVLRGAHQGFQVVIASAEGYAPKQELIQVPNSPGVKIDRTITLRKGVPVSGTVVDERGDPVAGVKVFAMSASSLVKLRGSAVATSSDKGEFKLPAVAEGAYRLTTHHKNYVKSKSDVVSVYTTEIRDIKIVVEKGATISGRVVDTSGNPVAWATVRSGPDETGMDENDDDGVRGTVSDDKGEFTIKGLPKIKTKLLAKSEDASSQAVKVNLEAKKDATGVTLTLDVKGSISGKVVDGEGEGVPEVQVTAIPDFWSGEKGNGFRLRGLATATTNGDGEFKISGLPQGGYRLKPVKTQISRALFARPGKKARTGDKDVTLELLDDGGIKGKLAFDNGDAVTIFTVTVSVPPGVPVSDKKGRFQLSKLTAGKHVVTFRGQGFAMTRQTVEVEPGKTKDLGTITVKKGRSVSGRVVDSGGSAVAKAKVIVARRLMGDGSGASANLGGGNSEASGVRSAVTDDDGYYQIMGIGETRRYILAEDAKLGRSLPYVIAPGKHSPRLDIRLQPFGAIKGKVTMNGAPAPKTTVLVTPKNTDGGQFVVVQTEQDGTYTVAKLPAGQHRVTAMIGGGMNNSAKGEDVVVQAGQETVLDIKLVSGDITLEVMVTGKAGAKVDAAQVILVEGTANWSSGLQAQRALLSGGANGKIVTILDIKKPAKFTKVNPGSYSLCVVPITGNIVDPEFGQKLQEHGDKLKIYCSPHTIKDAPKQQTHTVTTPAMDPLP